MKSIEVEKGNFIENAFTVPEDGVGNHIHENSFENPSFSRQDPAFWSHSGCDVALASLERIQVSLIRAAELFREENTQNANRFFIQCIDGLQRFLEAVRNTRTALSIDFKQIAHENGTLSDTEEHLLQTLKRLFQNQQRKQYEEIADRIEYELLTNLSSWNSALRKIQNSHSVF